MSSEINEIIGRLGIDEYAVRAEPVAKELALFLEFFNDIGTPLTDGEHERAKPYKMHPTHWIFIFRSFGFSDPKQNCWRSTLIPKSKHDFQNAVQMVTIRPK